MKVDTSRFGTLNIPENEIIHSSENVICYLLKEDRLSTSLRLLYEQYVLVV